MSVSDRQGEAPLKEPQLMPAVFVGHGNPMNGIEENEYVEGFRQLAQQMPKPKAILAISAHWETAGVFVTAMDQPRTIHDFGGFPPELFAVQYPAPGSAELAEKVQDIVNEVSVKPDNKWGLDHGVWTVIRHMYPEADIPVVQLSIDFRKSAVFHYHLAAELSELRSQGVLILGSGNLVHNLRMIAWDKLDSGHYAYGWAQAVNDRIKECILKKDHEALIDFHKLSPSIDKAVPSPEHFIPLLYILALQQNDDAVDFFNDSIVGGSLSMTSVLVGN